MANPSIQLGTNSNWAIKEDKLLAYKEYNDYFFNKEFDFSRGTSATYVAKDGLIKTAGIQPNIVNNGDFSELGSELITNGDFSDGSSNWVTEGGSSTWVIDNVANKISSSNFALYQNITRTVGKIYKISFDIVEYTSGTLSITLGNGASTSFNTAGSKTVYLEWDGSDDRIRFRSSFIGKIDNVSVKQVDPNDYWTLGTDWSFGDGKAVFDTTSNSSLVGNLNISSGKLYRVKIEGEVTSGNIKLSASSGLGNDQVIALPFQQDITHDGGANTIEIRTIGAAEGFITNITVQEIQTDTPRIDFTNDTKGHLLLEPQRTNSLNYSGDFSEWSTTGTVTSGQTGFDGSNNAFLFEQSGNAALAIQSNTTSGVQTFSVFAKGSVQNGLRMYAFGSSNVFTYFDLNLGVVESTSNTISNSIEDYGDGWYRCSMTFDQTNTVLYFYLSNNQNSNADTGSILLQYAQLENGSYSTSYIPTTGAASTRNADICNNSGSAQDFNSEEGVLYAEIAALTNDLSNRFISLTDGTDNNSVTIYYGGVSNRIRSEIKSGAVTQADLSTTAYNIINYNKIAVKYKQNSFSLYVNGTEVATDTSGSTPSGLNDLSFDRANILTFYGKVRNVQVFTEALTDAELQELTS